MSRIDPSTRRVNGLTNMHGSLETSVSLPARLVILVLKAYRRWISPYLMPACRFHPTCSVYAMEVIASFGFLKGGLMAIRRILKCQPFHPGGIDFPPKPSAEKTAFADPLRSRNTIAAQPWKQKND